MLDTEGSLDNYQGRSWRWLFKHLKVSITTQLNISTLNVKLKIIRAPVGSKNFSCYAKCLSTGADDTGMEKVL